MMEKLKPRTPVECLATGLVAWYAPDGRAVAVVVSWLALFGGDAPRLRVGWPGLRDESFCSWRGGEFVLNLLNDNRQPNLCERIRAGQVCLDIEADLEKDVHHGDQVAAPRIPAYGIQFECRNGQVRIEGFEAELSGEIVLVHRGRQVLQAPELADVSHAGFLRPVQAAVT